MRVYCIFFFFYLFYSFFLIKMDIFQLMLSKGFIQSLTAVQLFLLSLFMVFLAGCKSETPAQRPPVVKSSSSVQVLSSSSVEVADTVAVDTIVSNTVDVDSALSDSLPKEVDVQSSSSKSSSSSVASSSSLQEQVASCSSSEAALDTIVPVAIDSTLQEVALEQPPQEAPLDTAKDTVVTEEPPKDTSLCADVPASVLCDKRDGQLYRTVHIGPQVWMAQNLNYAVTNSWCYRNSLENCSNYGRLYQWTAAMNLDKVYSHSLAGNLIEERHQGVCPDGWYMPKDSDMEALVRYVKESNKTSGFAAEEVGTSLRKETGWEENDEEILGTNRYGFAAIPAGYRDANGSFAFLGEEADFWVAEEESNGTQAPHWNLYYANQTFSGEYRNLKTFAFSVRCIKR